MTKTIKRILIWLLTFTAILCISGLVACTSGSTGSYTITITSSENGTVTSDVSSADEGDTVNLTVTPDDGYVLESLLVNSSVTEVIDGKASFTMPADNVTVTATFIPASGSFSVSVTSADGGTVKADKSNAEAGATVTLTVTPDFGYELTVLEVNGNSLTATGGTATFTMPAAAATVTAEFSVSSALAVENAGSDTLDLSSKALAGGSAKAKMAFSFGSEALEVTVWVEDVKVLTSYDAYSLYAGRSGYEYTALSQVNYGVKVKTDGTVTQYAVTDGEYAETLEGAFTAVTMVPWGTSAGVVSGYKITLSIPYTALGLTADNAKGNVTVLPVLVNADSSLGSKTQVYGDYSTDYPGAYVVLTDNGEWKENDYALGLGQLGGNSIISAGNYWDLTYDYAEADANYAERYVTLSGGSDADNNLLFFRTTGDAVYAKATFRLDAVYNNEKYGKFGLMLFDGANETGVFFYVNADGGESNDLSQITGTALGHNIASGNAWGSWVSDIDGVFDLGTKTITLAMTYYENMVTLYYTNAEGNDIMVLQLPYTPAGDVSIGFKSFNYGLTVTNYYSISDPTDSEFIAHNPVRVNGTVFGDNAAASLSYGTGWTFDGADGIEAANYTAIGETAVYYRDMSFETDLCFSVDMKSTENTGADTWPKAGVILINDSITIFAYFDLNSGMIGQAGISYRLAGANWVWPMQMNVNANITSDYAKIGIAKRGDLIYLLVNGAVITSLTVPSVTASSSFVAGVMGFNRVIELKNSSSVTDTAELDELLAVECVDVGILLAGDSYMDYSKNLFSEFATTAGFDAGTIANAGVGGTQTTDWISEAYLNNVKARYNPDNIVFHIGVNDIDANALDAQTAYDRIVAMLEGYHTAFPSANIYWVSLIPNTMFASNNAVYYATNELMKTYAQETSNSGWCTYIDEWSQFSTYAGEADTEITVRTNMSYDGLHLNDEYGYPLWIKTIFAALGYNRAAGTVMGDNASGYAYSIGWDVSDSQLDAVYDYAGETGETYEAAVYYTELTYSANIYFEADVYAPTVLHSDVWPKVGAILRNDDVTVFAYYDLHSGSEGYVNIVYRLNTSGESSHAGDWDWNSQAGAVNVGLNMRNGFVNVGIAKYGATVYMLVDGEVVASMTVPGLTDESEVVAGVVGFDMIMQVKNATGTNDSEAIASKLRDWHTVTLPSLDGVTVSTDAAKSGKAQAGDEVTITVATEYEIAAVAVIYNGETHTLTANAEGAYTFTMPEYDVTVKITFGNVYTVELDSELTDKVRLSNSTVNWGETVTIRAEDNYVIDSLYANGEELTAVDGVYTLTAVAENITITGVAYYTTGGIVFDAETLEDVYGTLSTTANYSGDRYIKVYGVKLENGAALYVEAVMDTTYTESSNWFENTSLEFRFNGGDQRYVNINGATYGVTKFSWKTETLTSGKYKYTVELFVAADAIENFSDGDIQLNYAWKTLGETAYIDGDLIDHLTVTCGNLDWLSWHRIGGLYYNTDNEPLVANMDHCGYAQNLYIGAQGLVIDEAANGTIDGDLPEFEGKTSLTVGDASLAQVTVTGYAAADGLYLGLTVTHSGWSARNYTDWAANDNLEFKINGNHFAILFLDGKLVLPALVTSGAAVTAGSEGSYTTYIELFIADNASVYTLQMGINGIGFGKSWQSLIWDLDCAYITENGASYEMPTFYGVTLDGDFTESVYTDSVKNSAISYTMNGAPVSIIGVKLEKGVLLGVTVTHSKSTDTVLQEDGSGWWHYLDFEFRFNWNYENGTNKQFFVSVYNSLSRYCHFGYKTVDKGDGTYTTAFEIFVCNGDMIFVDKILNDDGTTRFNIFNCDGYNVPVFIAGVVETGYVLWNGVVNWHAYIGSDGLST